MPTLLGHSSHDHDFYLFGSIVQTSVAARGFDPLYVKTLLECYNVGVGHRIFLRDQNWGGAARNDVRVQVMYNFATAGNFPGTYGWIITIKDTTSGRNLVRVFVTNVNIREMALYYNNSTTAVENWVLVGAPFIVAAGVQTHTVTYYRHASAGIVQWHINGVLIAGVSGINTIFAGVSDFDVIDFGPFNTNGSGGWNAFAEHIVGSYDFPTYGLRDVQGQITGAGTTGTQALGVAADVSELVNNTATAMAFSAAGQRFTGASTDLPSALSSSPIMNVRVSAQARPGATGPGQVKIALQQSGGLALSGAITPGGIGFTTVAGNFPLTTAATPFDYAAYNASEPGVEAA